MYEVYLERAAEQDLRRLPAEAFSLVMQRLRNLAHDPRPRGVRKISGSQRDWRIRVGSYRILYEIDDREGWFGLCGCGTVERPTDKRSYSV